MSTVEDMLEERAWRDRNGLDDLEWDPDEVAPPTGDIYEREAKVGSLLGILARLAFAAAILALAAFTWWKL